MCIWVEHKWKTVPPYICQPLYISSPHNGNPLSHFSIHFNSDSCSSPAKRFSPHLCVPPLCITFVPLPTHKFTILHKVISTRGSFTVFSLLLFMPLFPCLLADLPSYVKPSAKEGSLFTIFQHTHTSPAWQEYVVLAIKHKGAGRRRIRERLQCRDRGFTERDEERQIEEVRALTLSWQRRTLSGCCGGSWTFLAL